MIGFLLLIISLYYPVLFHHYVPNDCWIYVPLRATVYLTAVIQLLVGLFMMLTSVGKWCKKHNEKYPR